MKIPATLLLTLVMMPALLALTEIPARAQSGPLDQGRIALTLKDSADRLQIFTIRPDGSDRRQLTFSGDNGRPAWSPDGKRIVYSRRRGNEVFVNVMDADGSNQRTFCLGEAPDWSPDGRTIAFSWNWAIWTIDADGSNRRMISRTPTAKKAPSWSRDGRQLAFILFRNPMSPHDMQPQVGVMMADGSGERVLTTGRRINDSIGPLGVRVREPAADANAPAWSPVADEIAFWSGKEGAGGDIWIMRADGGDARQLTAHQPSDDPSWSPDGRQILFSTGRSGRNELWVMDKDSGNQRRLYDIAAFPFPGRASWQKLPADRAAAGAAGQ